MLKVIAIIIKLKFKRKILFKSQFPPLVQLFGNKKIKENTNKFSMCLVFLVIKRMNWITPNKKSLRKRVKSSMTKLRMGNNGLISILKEI